MANTCIDTKNLVGHLAAWNYFQSVKNDTNTAFIKQWHDFIKNPKRVTNDPMEAHYIGFKMWVQAVQQADTTDVDAVRQATYGQKVKAPSGFTAVINTNHHLSKPVMIGEIRPDGQFDVVWQTKEPIKADAWSRRQRQGGGLELPLGLRQLHRAEIRGELTSLPSPIDRIPAKAGIHLGSKFDSRKVRCNANRKQGMGGSMDPGLRRDLKGPTF